MQIFDSEFHRQYVGGEGVVAEKDLPSVETKHLSIDYDQILAEYRRYVHDPKAELPEEVLDQLVRLGKI